jgi:hypothetical protein
MGNCHTLLRASVRDRWFGVGVEERGFRIHYPFPFHLLPLHFMIGLIAKFVNAVGACEKEDADDRDQNKCNENLCSAGLYNIRNVYYKLPPNQVSQWVSNESKHRVEMNILDKIWNMINQWRVGHTNSNKTYIKVHFFKSISVLWLSYGTNDR